ncbi:DUF5908 family protein [Chryseolinea soli]|uniref:Uncharacterized protein n=1 Tax=Chryseolinea soli TaxID=2321403 RepID=A0A385SUL6_9BACT|nr:DUF5908 family protein [Chryseolinea soli]AYB33991.1 hypothetical protein D4L85_26940 [Chryseolinea soli]
MPVVIRDLVVLAHIIESTEKKDGAQREASTQGATLNEEMRFQIVNAAVQQVMELLERQKDR